jgi:hypothetical protein
MPIELPRFRRRVRAIVLCAVAMVALGALTASSAWATSPPVNTSKPVILGNAEVGKKLTAFNGSWTESPTSYAYQWQRCNATGGECVNIAAATEKQYVLASEDGGHTIVVAVTAFNSAGEGTAASKPTKEILRFVEFTSATGKYPISFSYSSGPAWIEWGNGTVACSGIKESGQIAGPTEITAVSLKLEGCSAEGFKCATIEAPSLHGHFGYINVAEKRVGLILEESSSPFSKFFCQGGWGTLEGGVIGEIGPVNTSTSSFSLGYARSFYEKGVQIPDHFEGGGGEQLRWSWGIHSKELFAIEGSGTFVTSLKGKIVA